jgi:hypothetical protein
MIKFKCPGCGVSFKLSEEMMGKSGKCPKCGAAISVPIMPTRSPGNIDFPVETRPTNPQPIDNGSWDISPPRQPETPQRAWPLKTAIAGCVAIAIAIGLWTFRHHLPGMQTDVNEPEVALADKPSPQPAPKPIVPAPTAKKPITTPPTPKKPAVPIPAPKTPVAPTPPPTIPVAPAPAPAKPVAPAPAITDIQTAPRPDEGTPGPVAAGEIASARAVVASMAKAIIDRDAKALAKCYGVSDQTTTAKFRQAIETFHDMSAFCKASLKRHKASDVYMKAIQMPNAPVLMDLTVNSHMSNYQLLATAPTARTAVEKSENGLIVLATDKVKAQADFTNIKDVRLRKVGGQWCIVSGGLWLCKGIPTRNEVRFLSVISKAVKETALQPTSDTAAFLLLLNTTLDKHNKASAGAN